MTPERITRLRPQRVKDRCTISGWVRARDRGYTRSWRMAIDRDLRSRATKNETDVHWLDDYRN